MSSSNNVMDNFAIIKHLGQGSFAQVKLVRSLINEETCYAVKQMEHKNGTDEDVVETWKRESKIHQIASSVGHINILQLHRTEEDELNYYLFLDYASRGNVQERIEREVGEPIEKAQRHFRQLIEGIEFLHGLGIVHRDIKPSNMLLDKAGCLKIADFGFAALFRDSDGHEIQLADSVGSPSFMAPEMLVEGTPYDAQPVDIWAAGVSLVQMMTGKMPWISARRDSEKFKKWVDKSCLTELPWTRFYQYSLDFVSRMLAVNVEERMTIKEIKSHPFY